MLDRLLMLAGTVCAVMLPVFVGHGLAIHSYSRMLIGVAFAAVAGVLFFILLRMGPSESEERH